ncbi:hypothetical protein [Mesorhizobium sp. M1342]
MKILMILTSHVELGEATRWAHEVDGQTNPHVITTSALIAELEEVVS